MTLNKTIKIIFLFNFIRNLGFIGAVLIPFFTLWGKLEMWEIMFVQSWFLASIFLLEVPTGVVADKWGRKYSLAMGATFVALASFMYISYSNFYYFLLCESLFGIGIALISGADEAMIYDTLKENKLTKYAKNIFNKYENIKLWAILIAGPIGSLLFKFFGVRAPFFVFGLMSCVAIFIALSMKEPNRSSNVKESRRYSDIFFSGMKYLFRHKILWILALDFSVIYMIGYSILWYYQKKLMIMNIDIVYFGIVHVLFVISQIGFISFNPEIEKFLKSKKRLLFLSTIVAGIALIILGLSNSLIVVVPMIMIAGGIAMGRRPLFINYFNQQITSDERATVLSAISMFQKLVLVIVNPILGYFAGMSLNAVFIYLGIFAIIFAFLTRIKEEHLVN